MYSFFEQVCQNYQLLQDELSKKIFKARLLCDFEPLPENIMQLVNLGEEHQWLNAFKNNIPNIIHMIEQNPKKLILYGTNLTGYTVGQLLIQNKVDFFGFCGRRFKEFPNGIMEKPVISPDELFQYPDDFYVILSVTETTDEILNILKKNHFPQTQILSQIKPADRQDNQYFEFSHHIFHTGTAFVDCGCLDCRTSYLFADWCKGKYSKIFAFEPDPISYLICRQNLSDKSIRDIFLIQAGLSDYNGEASFRTGLYGASHITDNCKDEQDSLMTIRITTVDDTVGEEKVGFIKMDIEGSEFSALHGAKKVIVRDKPLLAISVYHIRGDLLAIIDYLHQLVPEYYFWLRHYSLGTVDTVLYASTEVLFKE